MTRDDKRPSFQAIYMQMAVELAKRSTCTRLHVGCVITSADFRQVLAVGYNGNASGLRNGCDSDTPGSCGCFLPGTLIDFSTLRGTQRAYRRRYKGGLVRVITGNGEFTATEHHPILTLGRGWIAAKFLTESDYLFSPVGGEGLFTDTPDDKHYVSIEDIFQAARESGSSLIGHPGASHNFHGDGIVDEDVDVVTIDRSLRANFESRFYKSFGKIPFSFTDKVKSSLSSSSLHIGREVVDFQPRSTLYSSYFPAFDQAASDRRPAHFEEGCHPVDRLSEPISSNYIGDVQWKHGLSLIPVEVLGYLAQNSDLSQAILNNSMRNTGQLSDLKNRFSSLVKPYKVLRVERYSGTSHVYNLQTDSGWYSVAKGRFIVKNCVHGEANAIINCAAPRSVEKVVFCTDLPCKMCAKYLVNLGGVVQVHYLREYRLREGEEVLDQAKIPICQFLI